MKHLSLCTIVFSMLLLANLSSAQQIDDERFVSYIVDLNKQTLKFYLKNDNGHNFGNHLELKNELKTKNKELIFATNGGMYLKDGSPQGLYIENGTVKKPVNTIKSGYGNFYLQPNGVFYITNENKAIVCETSQYTYSPKITYATQSGPMLVIDGKIHAVFKKNSEHFHIRNGVGVLPNGKLLFAMSKDTITLYDFADFFKSQGCENALYLDGFISRTYLPKKKWEQLDGHFGVIIAEIKE
ncbi:phosphodiester glycosidase family protein [Psychroserpens algicola]|uniref:Phosphodiester glycosidase family protein n=1 Tax=Psychroserpens algicola TaxID=1719034 RepID=A0ABT0H8U6_9FLAO|nr:phosphodiester glycosidase family protein [Psychroserpens algicola]MCK8480265.1 phosphodiester glycosidase family protein [Psychroserpens algicola]